MPRFLFLVSFVAISCTVFVAGPLFAAQIDTKDPAAQVKAQDSKPYGSLAKAFSSTEGTTSPSKKLKSEPRKSQIKSAKHATKHKKFRSAKYSTKCKKFKSRKASTAKKTAYKKKLAKSNQKLRGLSYRKASLRSGLKAKAKYPKKHFYRKPKPEKKAVTQGTTF